MTVSDHGSPNPTIVSLRDPHVHLLVGNISRTKLDPIVRDWKRLADDDPDSTRIEPVTHAWGAIHYMCSQHKNAQGKTSPYAHRQDPFSYCPALLCPPFESDNLEVLRVLFTRILNSRRGRSTALSPEARSARARNAALARWSKPS